AEYMLALAVASDPARNGGPPRFDLLAGERENLGTAYEFLSARDRAAAADLAAATAQFMVWHGPVTLLHEWLEEVLADPQVAPRVRVEALNLFAFAFRLSCDYERAGELAGEALVLARREGFDYGIYGALLELVFVAAACGDREPARTLADETYA